MQNSISFNLVEIQTQEESLLDKLGETSKAALHLPRASKNAIYLHLRDDLMDSKLDREHLTFTAADVLKIEIGVEKHINIILCERIKNGQDLTKKFSYEEIKNAKTIYQQREEGITLLLKEYTQVIELRKVDQVAGRCFAENLVDVQMISSEKVLDPIIIEQQKVIAIAQANIIRSISQTDPLLRKNMSNSKIISDTAIIADHIQKTEYIKYELHKSLTKEMMCSASLKLDVTKVQVITNEVVIKADKKLRLFKQEYSKNRGQELQQNQLR